MKKYTKQHEWIEEKDGRFFVGISQHAANELGDITFIEFPDLDSFFEQEESFLVVESVKAAVDVYMPIDATVIAINEELEDNPNSLSSNAEDIYLCEVKVDEKSDLEQLMSFDDYQKFLEE